MTPEQYAVVRRLFHQAEALPVGERRAFVDGQTTDPELRSEVLSLLEFHDAEAARAEGGTVRSKSGPTVVSQGTGSQSLAEMPSAIRVAKASGQANRSLRRLRTWLPLWLPVLLATVLLPMVYVGGRRAAQQHRAARYDQLQSTADAAAFALQQWVAAKRAQVAAWAQDPQLREHAFELVRVARQDSPSQDSPSEDSPRQDLLDSPVRDRLAAHVAALVGVDVRYVFWNRNGTTLASWLEDAGDIGNPISAEGSAELSRAFAGEIVIHKPDYIEQPTKGFVPANDRPLMWLMTPLRDDNQHPQAVMLIRGIGLYDEYCELLRTFSFERTGGVYAVDDRGRVRSKLPPHQPLAELGLLPPETRSPVKVLRAGDPGQTLRSNPSSMQDRSTLPLTIAASRAAAKQNGQTVSAYRDHRGVPVIGAWRWVPELEVGLIVEIEAEEAFAPLHALYRSLWAGSGVLILGAGLVSLFLQRQFRPDSPADRNRFGHYELLDELGSGGMGVVYRARHQLMKRPAALKVIRPDRLDQESTLRFDREVQLAAGLQSPHSVSVFDYGWTNDGRAYCAMQLLDGITIHQAVSRGGKMPPGRVVHILLQICDSLSEAHQLGLVHRDVKPRNIMLAEKGECRDWAVLFDFGLAKPTTTDHELFKTQERIWAGTPMFMAPERFRNPTGTDPRSDIYSLGAVGYFMLAGSDPYSEIDPSGLFEVILSSTPPRLSKLLEDPELESLADTIHACMAKSPERRPQSVAELYEQLLRLRGRYPWTRQQAQAWWQEHGEPDKS
ncbi:serine/threonine protein kinase [Roseimaritima sediminicola]|uniref:serine/threonine protein kinase n=1 Tax=Roseimaritima sediminicola TaxID=2662066 RepID=UPI00129825B0|nr:serine/threonine protein kinase [Roseimaritima sediminicola]